MWCYFNLISFTNQLKCLLCEIQLPSFKHNNFNQSFKSSQTQRSHVRVFSTSKMLKTFRRVKSRCARPWHIITWVDHFSSRRRSALTLTSSFTIFSVDVSNFLPFISTPKHNTNHLHICIANKCVAQGHGDPGRTLKYTPVSLPLPPSPHCPMGPDNITSPLGVLTDWAGGELLSPKISPCVPVHFAQRQEVVEHNIRERCNTSTVQTSQQMQVHKLR